MSETLGLVLSAALGYLMGSVSFSIILSRLRYRDDIRRYGSGNAGMTNTLRTYGKLSAAIVLAGDFGKGFLAAWIGWRLGGSAMAAYLAGLCAVVGHMFPLYFGFRGGKGVATAAGVILGTCPRVFWVVAAVFVAIIFFSRYVSLGSILGAALYPVVMAFLGWGLNDFLRIEMLCSLVIGGLVIWAHRGNIQRLLAGTERKLGQKAGQRPPADPTRP